MGRRLRNRTLGAALMRAPWWVGVAGACGTVLFFWVLLDSFHLPGAYSNPVLGALDAAIHTQSFRQIGWIGVAIFLASAAAAGWRSYDRGALLEQQRDINGLRELSWQAFERLVGEAYRRAGYRVVETGQGGADGGVDLMLRKGGAKVIVQCKQWRANSIGAPVVREMFGLMGHHGAERVKIVCSGRFTKDAIAFAEGKPIDLVSGEALLELVEAVRDGRQDVPATGEEPACPDCGGPMARRHSKKSREVFWGCTAYPICSGTRQVH